MIYEMRSYRAMPGRMPDLLIIAAQVVIGTLEGAMLVARLHADPARLEAAADQLLAELS